MRHWMGNGCGTGCDTGWVTDETDRLSVLTNHLSATSAMPLAIRCRIRYALGYPVPHPLHPLCPWLSGAASATSAMPLAIRCRIRYKIRCHIRCKIIYSSGSL
jgi:hypothetical protein